MSNPTDIQSALETTSGKAAAITVYTAGSLAVIVLGAVSAVVLAKTTQLTVANVGHALATKGKIWMDSKFHPDILSGH